VQEPPKIKREEVY
jgi:hypothetical protein